MPPMASSATLGWPGTWRSPHSPRSCSTASRKSPEPCVPPSERFPPWPFRGTAPADPGHVGHRIPRIAQERTGLALLAKPEILQPVHRDERIAVVGVEKVGIVDPQPGLP